MLCNLSFILKLCGQRAKMKSFRIVDECSALCNLNHQFTTIKFTQSANPILNRLSFYLIFLITSIVIDFYVCNPAHPWILKCSHLLMETDTKLIIYFEVCIVKANQFPWKIKQILEDTIGNTSTWNIKMNGNTQKQAKRFVYVFHFLVLWQFAIKTRIISLASLLFECSNEIAKSGPFIKPKIAQKIDYLCFLRFEMTTINSNDSCFKKSDSRLSEVEPVAVFFSVESWVFSMSNVTLKTFKSYREFTTTW